MASSYDPKNIFKDGKRQKTEFNKSKTEQMFNFMVNAFKAASNAKEEWRNKSNDKKRKANENYAFDDDVFNQFNIDDMHDIINQDDENNTDSDE
jgi:hypothetical protein